MLASRCFLMLVNNRDSEIFADSEYDRLQSIAMVKSSASSNPHDCSVAHTIMTVLLGATRCPLSAGDICDELFLRLETTLDGIHDSGDLLRMATTAPIYSSLFCVRRLLEEHLLAVLERVSVERIVGLCYRVNELIFPFIASAAPEGCLPSDVTLCWPQSAATEVDRHSAEYLTICCWRSCKEVSLLLGHVAAALVDRQDSSSSSSAQVVDIANFFFSQLTTVTHKGAFESVSVGFKKLCHALWRCPTSSTLSGIPREFIERSISILRSSNEDLCATRRSAGLPHLFLALITTEPLANKQRASLSAVMDQLHAMLAAADLSVSADQKRIVMPLR